MSEATFASGACGASDFGAILFLGKSIREFAGGLSGIDFKVYIPSCYWEEWKGYRTTLARYSIVLVKYDAAETDIDFEYSFKILAAKAAEDDAADGTVMWLDRHTLVLNHCADLLLSQDEMFAYRPVNKINIGSLFDEPLNKLWETIYLISDVNPNDVFPVTSAVDRLKARAYFFGCLYAFNPKYGLMNRRMELFNKLRNDRRMAIFLEDSVIRTFLHQVALCVSVLSIKASRTRELPYYYGYPVHFHSSIPPYYQARNMESINIASYYYERIDYKEMIKAINMSDDLKKWLMNTIKEIDVYKGS